MNRRRFFRALAALPGLALLGKWAHGCRPNYQGTPIVRDTISANTRTVRALDDPEIRTDLYETALSPPSYASWIPCPEGLHSIQFPQPMRITRIFQWAGDGNYWVEYSRTRIIGRLFRPGEPIRLTPTLFC